MDAYIAFVHRGLDGPVREMVLKELTPQFSVQLDIIGEYPRFEPTNNFGASYPTKLKERLEEIANRKRQRTGTQESEALLACCSHPVGVVNGEEKGIPNESLGYNSQGEPVWCTGGNFVGVLWLRILTNAPPIIISTRLRCLGPLLALIDFQHGTDWNFEEKQDMDSLCQQFQQLANLPSYNLEPALLLWQRHATECWPKYQSGDANQKQTSTDLSNLRFRLSCTRAESKGYKVSRQDLLRQVGKFVAPDPLTKDWTVNLNDYDVEIVVALRPHCVAVGFALKPHQYFGKGFASGLPCPPDISLPHLPIQHSDNVVRLRPNNAQSLLHLANLRTGEVVVDPCVGIGTICFESQLLADNERATSVYGIGGDLVLTPSGFGTLANQYSRKAKAHQADLHQHSNARTPAFRAEVAAWDACNLPFRSGIADAIVSDLPFGQSCLSSAKLQQVLPLLINEFARILSPRTGRMVLLCGNYASILENLYRANQEAESSPADKGIKTSSSLQWKLPCQAIFPVNIGGVQAWIIQVERAEGAAVELKNKRERVQKLISKREVREKKIQGIRKKQKRLQA